MPRLMGGFSNKNSWTNKANVPRCGPARSEMTLMEAAAQMNGKNKRALKQAQADLVTAKRRNDKNGARIAQNKINKIRGR